MTRTACRTAASRRSRASWQHLLAAGYTTPRMAAGREGTRCRAQGGGEQHPRTVPHSKDAALGDSLQLSPVLCTHRPGSRGPHTQGTRGLLRSRGWGATFITQQKVLEASSLAQLHAPRTHATGQSQTCTEMPGVAELRSLGFPPCTVGTSDTAHRRGTQPRDGDGSFRLTAPNTVVSLTQMPNEHVGERTSLCNIHAPCSLSDGGTLPGLSTTPGKTRLHGPGTPLATNRQEEHS